MAAARQSFDNADDPARVSFFLCPDDLAETLVVSLVVATSMPIKRPSVHPKLAQMSRIGLNLATDDRVRTSQCPLPVRTRSAFATHVSSREFQLSIHDGRRAGSLGSAAGREQALRELVGAWLPPPSVAVTLTE